MPGDRVLLNFFLQNNDIQMNIEIFACNTKACRHDSVVVAAM